MKTFFEKLIVHFEVIAHPAAGAWLKIGGQQRKRKATTNTSIATLSPECYNVRGLSKKAGNVRCTPAP